MSKTKSGTYSTSTSIDQSSILLTHPNNQSINQSIQYDTMNMILIMIIIMIRYDTIQYYDMIRYDTICDTIPYDTNNNNNNNNNNK
jgi:hypothetical protein